MTAGAFESLAARLAAGDRTISVTGLRGGALASTLTRLFRAGHGPFVCVTPDEDRADALANDLLFFLGKGAPATPSVLRLPADEQIPYDALSPDRHVPFERLATLFHLSQGTRSAALVLSAPAVSRRVLAPAELDAHSELVGVEQELDRDALAAKLVAMGYQSVPLVEDAGTFAVRGGLVDVWSPLHDKPVRLEFFGDLVESLRLFEPDTQRTAGALETLLLCPAREILFDERTRAFGIAAVREAADAVNRPSSKVRELLDGITEGRLVHGLEALMPGFWGREELCVEPAAHALSRTECQELLAARRQVLAHAVHLAGPHDTALTFEPAPTAALRQEIQSHHGEDGALTPLATRLHDWRDRGLYAAIACGSSGQVDRLKRLLLDRKLMVRTHLGEAFPSDPPKAYEPAVHAHLWAGDVSSGFVDPEAGLALLAEDDVFGQRTRKVARRARGEQPFVAAFRELKEGDLVVHVDYGIGRYAGLTRMNIRGIGTDALVLEYAGKDKVYLPVQRLRLLQKFTGSDAENVTLDRLGSGSWERRKSAVKEHLLQMAAELLRLYAARKAHPGHAFSAPDELYRQFEADFPYEETPDQAKAIADVLADMQSQQPMDRLVCGDVGYGKTEVALRATFQAVLDKKQVAILVPTTLLASQHLRNFTERFKDYPITVASVSRLQDARENREVLKRAAEGKVDVLIGTHRLLAADVSFKDLGLVVIDEEQRFGVAHKEKLKKYRSQVDVLTLTATPIPRTLHLSMSGMRDLSIIASPPEDRKAIRTFVLKFDPAQIAEAIRRELARGGQVYFVHNRVESIHEMAQYVAELVPEARYAVAHGQMGEGELEEVMSRFIQREVDVLVSSSIIESGLDIPAANTILVNRADTFGLAQLYQIRGRVGRSRERAYAYLLVPAKAAMTKDAAKRLEVLQSFTELGAGFSIASHDLEIRGAGNLLGPDQSGQIAAVGFDLYAQMLEEAVHELRGEPPSEILDPDVNLPVPAFIPDDYVPDIHLRLVFYKRFASVQNDDELSDLRGEMQDRFGDLPDEVDNLSEVMTLKTDMRRLRVRALESGPGRLVVTLGPDAHLVPAKLTGLVQRSKGALRLTPEMKLVKNVPPEAKAPADVLAEAKRLLRDLLKCQTVEYLDVPKLGPKLKR